MPEYLTQTDSPLYENILWSKPLTRQGAGNLLLIGGKTGSFSHLQSFYALSEAAGIGRVKMVLPDSLSRVVGSIDQVFYVPSTPSGSLARAALAQILALATDYDALILGDDVGRNSETTIMLEAIINQTDQPLVIFGESLSGLKFQAQTLLRRPHTLLIADMLEIFKLAGAAQVAIPAVKHGGLAAKVAAIEALQQRNGAHLAVAEQEIIIVTDQISVTPAASKNTWVNPLISTFWVQNPTRPFESLTTGAFIARAVQSENPAYTVQQAATTIRHVLGQFL